MSENASDFERVVGRDNDTIENLATRHPRLFRLLTTESNFTMDEWGKMILAYRGFHDDPLTSVLSVSDVLSIEFFLKQRIAFRNTLYKGGVR